MVLVRAGLQHERLVGLRARLALPDVDGDDVGAALAREGHVAGEFEGDPTAEDRGVLERLRLFPRHPEDAELGETLREQRRLGRIPASLAGRTVALLFEKPSLRTRVTFDVGIKLLGGHPVYLSPEEVGIGHRETATDVGRNLSRWVDGIVFRTFGHDTLVELASVASVPVVNALSDHEHPCQALADMLTLRQHLGSLRGKALAYVGDGNNVCHSLLLAGSLAGLELRVATPPGYEPDPAGDPRG